MDYLEENTTTAAVTSWQPAGGSGSLNAVGSGSRIVIPPLGEQSTSVINFYLRNPRRFMVQKEILLGDVPADPAVFELTQPDSSYLQLKISNAASAPYSLTIKMKSPDGLRNFVSYPFTVDCKSFNADATPRLKIDSVTTALGSRLVEGNVESYSAYSETAAAAEFTVEPLSTRATVDDSVSGATDTNAAENIIAVNSLSSGSVPVFTFVVTAENGVTQKIYRLTLVRDNSGIEILPPGTSGLRITPVAEADRTIPYTTGSVTFTLERVSGSDPVSFASPPQWYVDGSLKGNGNPYTLTPSGAGLVAGTYQVTAEFKLSGDSVTYSEETTLVVLPE